MMQRKVAVVIRRLLAVVCLALSGLTAVAGSAHAELATTTITGLQGFREIAGSQAAESGPVDVLVGPDATMWMLDGDGSLWHLVAGRLRRFTRPVDLVNRHITIDGWGRIAEFVHDGRGRIVLRRYWPDGRHDDVPIAGRSDPDPTADITADRNGNVWFYRASSLTFSDVTLDGRVHDYRVPRNYLGGGFAYTFGPAFGFSLAVGFDGNLWFDDGITVGRFTPSGRFLSPIRVVPPSSSSGALRVARGSDDAMWVGISGDDAFVRIDPKTRAITNYPLFSQSTAFDFDRVFPAMAPGPGASIWPITGYDGFDVIEDIASDSIQPVGPHGLLTDTVEFFPFVRGNQSSEHFGLVAGLDGRMWFTDRLFNKIEAWRSPWWKPSPRGRTRVLGVHRVGRFARVDLGCVGKTGGYCTGSLQLRANGRLIGRLARYALAAGPPAVKSRSARWLPLPRADRARSVRLRVQRHRVPGL